VTPVPDLNLAPVVPVGTLGVGAMGVLLGEVFLSRSRALVGRTVTDSLVGTLLAFLTMAVLGVVLFFSSVAFVEGGAAVFNPTNPMLRLDPFSALASALLALTGLLSVALSMAYLAELRINHGEYYALLLLSLAGMLVLVASVDLLALFLGFELMSLPVYVLAGFDRRKLRSNESALKYFLMGSFASAVMLFGMALLYGATGGTGFETLRQFWAPTDAVAAVGAGLLLVGFAFKVAAAPFHQWAPDVYEGAPSAVTAFMSVAVKTAAFAALLRLFVSVFDLHARDFAAVLWVLAALSMVVGNAMAVIQNNVKRMLAYSSIAHAGYVLVGFAAGGESGHAAVVFYLIVYAFMNLGAFGVVVTLANRGGDCERIDSFAGLAQSRPGLAALMTVFLLSLAGIPGTAGFIAKFNVFLAAVERGMIGLAIVLVLTSVVSVFYYLRIPVAMYMREPGIQQPRLRIDSAEALALLLCAAAVLFFGFFPNDGAHALPLLDWARASVAALHVP
jgi:NADH-quinone oxidoreductase subunit N